MPLAVMTCMSGAMLWPSCSVRPRRLPSAWAWRSSATVARVPADSVEASRLLVRRRTITRAVSALCVLSAGRVAARSGVRSVPARACGARPVRSSADSADRVRVASVFEVGRVVIIVGAISGIGRV